MVALSVPLHRTRRVTLLRFLRAVVSADPDEDMPDIDFRGERGAEFGGVVGVMVGRTVRVRLRRLALDGATNLFAVSSDPAVFTVAGPAALPVDTDTEIRFTGVDGGADSRDARLEIRLDSADPGSKVLGYLTVRVYVERNVDITPHRIQLVRHHHGADTLGAVPIANLAAIMAKVRAVWIHYGVTFAVAAEGPVEQVRVGNQDYVSDDPYPGELARVLRSNWVDHSINVYFVDRIGTGNTLGYGFSRSSARADGLPHPGILLADRTGGAGGGRAGVMHWANDLAHEIGHFFRLWHVGYQEPPGELESTWSRRQLMHNFNQMRDPDPWPATNADGANYTYRPRFPDVGYGASNRGCLVTMKAIRHVQYDDQAGIARATLGSPAGPY